jgi:hypothetical protein
MRKCRLCKVVKPLDDFYAHPQMIEGHDSKCKECAKAIVHAAKARRPEYYKEYDRDRAMLPHRVLARTEYQKTENGKQSLSKSHKKYKIKYPDRNFAVTSLNNAVRDGKISKPFNCSVCNQDRIRIHGHHNDYSKPFEVTWMCHRCHMEWHKHNEPKRIEGF